MIIPKLGHYIFNLSDVFLLLCPGGGGGGGQEERPLEPTVFLLNTSYPTVDILFKGLVLQDLQGP
jgi:hypothetical protein